MLAKANDGEEIDAAKRFAPGFVTSIDELQDMLRSTLFAPDAKPGHKTIWVVQMELLVFFMVLIDRIAFSRFGSKQRAAFMDCFLNEIREIVCNRVETQSEVEHMYLFLPRAYNQAQQEYSRFKAVAPQEGQSPAGTLIWEFSKKMGEEHAESNPIVVMKLSLLLSASCVEMFDMFDEALRGR